MKYLILICLSMTLLVSCQNAQQTPSKQDQVEFNQAVTDTLALNVKAETLRTWKAYKKYGYSSANYASMLSGTINAKRRK